MESNRTHFVISRKKYGSKLIPRGSILCDWLGRVQPIEILVKLVFHLFDPVKFYLSLRDFGKKSKERFHGDMTWLVPVAYTLHVFLPGTLCAGAWYLRRIPPTP